MSLTYKLRGKREEEIVRLAQQGNKESVDILVNKYYPMVYKISQKYFVQNAEREDIIQNGLVGIMKAIYYFKEGKSKFSSFVWRSVESEIMTFVSQSNRKKHLVLTEATSIEEQIKDAEGISYEETLENKNAVLPQVMALKEKKSNFIRSLLESSMKPKEMEVIDKYLENYSYKEIAALTGYNTKKIDNITQKAKRILKKNRELLERLDDEIAKLQEI
jgi:RNA polymerase sporulation-specific sigma factor